MVRFSASRNDSNSPLHHFQQLSELFYLEQKKYISYIYIAPQFRVSAWNTTRHF